MLKISEYGVKPKFTRSGRTRHGASLLVFSKIRQKHTPVAGGQSSEPPSYRSSFRAAREPSESAHSTMKMRPPMDSVGMETVAEPGVSVNTRVPSAR